MHRDTIPPQRMHAACRIVTRGLYCTLRISAATVKTIIVCVVIRRTHEGKSASGTYHPKTEGDTRRYLYRPPGRLFAVLWGCTWTRIRRQPIIAITWHFSQQALLEPFTVTGASASCFDERYRDVCTAVPEFR